MKSSKIEQLPYILTLRFEAILGPLSRSLEQSFSQAIKAQCIFTHGMENEERFGEFILDDIPSYRYILVDFEKGIMHVYSDDAEYMLCTVDGVLP